MVQRIPLQENSAQYLSLAEVQVLGAPDLAAGKPATQSSVLAGTSAAASLACLRPIRRSTPR
jgi:hypothetical protein